jgi:hypothetical protein
MGRDRSSQKENIVTTRTEWLHVNDADPALVCDGETVATSETTVGAGKVAVVLGHEPLFVIQGTRDELASLAVKFLNLVGVDCDRLAVSEEPPGWCNDCGAVATVRSTETLLHVATCPRIAGNS